ncbi:hypothetical protein Aperf_G00000030715 [Anoplocephala perfoliata]
MAISTWLQEIKSLCEGHKWLITISLGAYVTYRVVRKCYREFQLPPGPVGWPWIGYTDCLGKDAFEKVQLLCRKYGPVISFRVCGKLVVILSDEKSIKEAAFKNRQLIGRHAILTNHILAKGYGISNYDGENALTLRRIFVRAIYRILPGINNRNGSLSDPPLEQIIIINSPLIDEKLDVECEKLLKYLRQANGEPLKINSIIRRMVWHVVWKAAFGTDCQLDDTTITGLMQCIAENNSQNGPFQFKQMLPNFLSKILMHSKTARRMLGVNEIWDRYERITSVLRQSVAELRSSSNRNKECLLPVFLDSKEYAVSRPNADRLAFEIMAAGVDTTTLTLMWCCYALSIGKVVLKPGEAFTESHLEVVHRLASVVPMALPHYARFDGHVGGYLIPKDSVVFYNLYAVHQAQLMEKDPTKICPFAQNNNPKLKMYLCESAMPFSVGSRACPGFMFATRVILRVVNSIIKEFKIVEFQKPTKLTEDHLHGLTRPPVNDTYQFVEIS